MFTILLLVSFSFNSNNQQNIVPLKTLENNPITEIVVSTTTKNTNLSDDEIESKTKATPPNLFEVVRVVDGDTIDVDINGKKERLRLIGINTPETVDPRKPVECFGIEASNKAKSILEGHRVKLESDITQGDFDKYGRLLRYVFLEDGTNFNLLMIKEGYAYEYTYGTPYKYQAEFKQAQKYAEQNKLGLWGDVCQNNINESSSGVVPVAPATETMVGSSASQNNCIIKGNINSKKEKIYHMIGCGSYNQTVIDETTGERWFCTEQEAVDAGWRKALNCN